MEFTDYDIECIKRAKSIIDADTSTHYSIEFIAEKIGIGKTKLKIGFKKYFRMGLFTYLREQRMIKAAELLIHSNRTIKKIAKATGFKYCSNFISALTTYHGLPPSRYRDFFSTKQLTNKPEKNPLAYTLRPPEYFFISTCA